MANNGRVSPTIHYVLHATLGACLGFFWAVIFLLFFYFEQTTEAISYDVRFWSAFWMANFIFAGIIVCLYCNPVLSYFGVRQPGIIMLKKMFEQPAESEVNEE